MRLLHILRSNLAIWITGIMMLLSSICTAQTFTFDIREESEVRTAHQIKNHDGLPDTIDVRHEKWDNIRTIGSGWGNILKLKSLQSFVKFSVKHKPENKVHNNYTYKLMYQLRGYTNPLDTNAFQTVYDTLVVTYKQDSLAAFQDINIKRYTGFHRLKVIMTDIYEIQNADTTPPVWVDMSLNSGFNKFNFEVEAMIVTQPYIKQVNTGGNNYVSVYGWNAPALHTDKAPVVNNTLPVKWNVTGNNINADLELTPVNYELEWLYVDNYQMAPGDSVVGEKDTSELRYDFKHNSTRVTVSKNNFNIPLIYQNGYLVYRVRAVRPDSALFKLPVYGKWSLPAESGTISSLPTTGYYKISTPHNNDSLNWQYTISFAEQGKYKHVLSYYDGMLKNRQSITRFNSLPGKLIATEQIYDHEGRPSISILPTPIQTSDFRYQYGLAINAQTNQPYKAFDFDNFTGDSCAVADVLIDTLASGALARIYYSSSNPDTAGYQRFVPDAQGYPLVQTIYSPGFEDRVDKQGGAGAALQIGNGHASKNNYVSADQADLNRMFGLNVGLSGFYRKTVSKDPNGQLSLNYTDFRGKTMASSLIGIPDTTSLALLPNNNAPDTSSFWEDHLAGMQQQIIGNTKILDKVYFNDVAGNNNFLYTASFQPFPTFCPNKFLSVKTAYHYTVADECGTIKADGSGSLGTTGVDTSGAIVNDSATQNVFLESGAHAIHKKLTFNSDDVVTAVDAFMVLDDNCMKTEQDFIKEEVLSRQFPCAVCKTVCDELKDDLMKELWPNYNSSYSVRKYGIYTDTLGIFTSNDNSIFTLVEIPGSGGSGGDGMQTYDPLYNYYRYQDTCLVTLPDTVVRFGQVYTNLRALPVDTFIAIFNDDIAEALLPLHPEYCELLKCAVDTFKDIVVSIPDAATAASVDMQMLQEIILKDPLYQNMVLAAVPSPMDSLSKMKMTGFRIDSLALLMAYCQGGDPVMYQTCAQEIFSNNISNTILTNAYVKEQYFKMMRNLYFVNRQNYIRFLTPADANTDCPRCLPVRMTLDGMGNFVNPVDFSNPYMGNPFGLSASYFNQLNQINPGQAAQLGSFLGSFSDLDAAFAAAMDSLNNNPNSNFDTSAYNYLNAFTSMSSAYNMALSTYNTGDSLLNAGAINYIIDKLVNCANATTLQVVRNKLSQLTSNGVVQLGKFNPHQIRWALLSSGVSLTDLCHPYLITYDAINPTEIPKIGCGTQNRMANLTTIINYAAVKQALQYTGTEFTFTLPNVSDAEQEIITRIGTAALKVKANFNSNQNTYTLKLYANTSNDNNAVAFYFKNVDTSAIGLPFSLGSGEHFTVDAICISESPVTATGLNGYIGAFVFYAKVTKSTGSGNVIYNMAAWNNSLVIGNTNVSNIAGTIPCTDLYSLYDVFVDTMASFGIHHVDHPYFNTSLKNFLNYNLKRSYSAEEYLGFMESCALTDKVLLAKQTGYATLFFSSQAGVNTFLNAMQQYVDTSISIVPLFQYRQGVSSGYYGLVIDLLQLPETKWKAYKDYIVGYAGLGLMSKSVNQTLHNIEGSNFLAWIISGEALTPTQLTQLGAATGFTVSNANQVGWYNGSSYQAAFTAKVTGVVSGYSATAKAMDTLQKYVQINGINAVVFDRYQGMIHTQYSLPSKSAYISYVNLFEGQPRSTVLDTIRPQVLQQQLPLFAGQQLSYGALTNASAVNNLYAMHPANDTAGTKNAILNAVLQKAAFFFGSQKLFGLNRTYTIESNQKLMLYRNSDNMFWYRYFGDADYLYNVYVIPPKYLNVAQLVHYQMHSIQLMPGDTGSNSFKLTLRRPGHTPEYVTLNGYTDFKIGNNRIFNDVLLPDPSMQIEQDILMNCERYRLDAAIYQGKVRYIHYRDSIRNTLINDFAAYVLQGVSETLTSNYKTQRFNYTLYEYDRAQNLIRTIPPAGASFLSNPFLNDVNGQREAGSNNIQYLPQHNKVSTYEYNTLNQVVQQKTPDGGKTLFFYDGAGRVIYSQNEQQRLSGKMTYTLYDAQSRIIETGQAAIACSPHFDPYESSPPANLSCGYYVQGFTTPYPPQVQAAKNFTNTEIVSFVRALTREDVVLTHYDDAVVTLGGFNGMDHQDNLRKRVATIKFFSMLSPTNTNFSGYDYAMHFSYDIAGNVKTLTRDYPAWAPAGQRFKRVDYDYDLISGKVNLLSYNRGFADQFYQQYDYDADNRITEVHSSSDGVIWARDAAYEYYQHGPLARMSLGEHRVQGVDYAYTIQGWLKTINGDILDPATDLGQDALGSDMHAKDAVALSIDYFDGDYKPIGQRKATYAPAVSKNLYNGNIPRTSAAIKPFDNLSTTYTYDQLNRLVRSDYATLHQDNGLSPTAQYRNAYAYDADGNIQKLVRNGNNPATLAMDSIVYRYTVGSIDNRLQNVNDYVADNYSNDIKQNTIANVSRYMYDKTGNLIKDLVSGQDTIQWNHYNKVTQVVQSGGDSTVLRFDYDGSGQRYMKTNVVAQADTTVEKGEYYVRDAQGNILAVYKAESRYEMSPTTVWEYVIMPAIMQVGSTAFINNFMAPAYAQNSGFQAYMINNGLELAMQDAVLSEYTPSYFLSNNHALYTGFLNSTEHAFSMFEDLRNYSENAEDSNVVLAAALFQQSFEKDEFHNNLMNALYNPDYPGTLEQAIKALWHGDENVAAELFKNLDLPHDPENEEGNLNALFEYISGGGSKNLNIFIEVLREHVTHGADEIAGNYYSGLALNTYIQTEGLAANENLLWAQQQALASYGYKPAFGAFADEWGVSEEVLSTTASGSALLQAVYNANTASFIQAVYSGNGSNNAFLFEGLSAAYNGLWASNIFHLQDVLQTHLQYQIPVTVWQNVLKYQHLNVSSHHIYGSSRLGTRDYLSGQLYANVDLTGSSPVMDTLLLTARRPWYSQEYRDIISGGSTTPWGMAHAQPMHFASQIGQKQYELSNHLGNVQATVSDLPYYSYYIAEPQDSLVKTFEPALVSAYDYYPFGMLMPGRYVSDTSSRTMTISRTGWSTIMADTCRPLAVLATNAYYVGGGTSNVSGGQLHLTAPQAGDAVGLHMQVAANVDNSMAFNVKSLTGANDAGLYVTVIETIDNVPYVIGGGRLNVGDRQQVSFRSTGNNVSLMFNGPFNEMQVATICTQYPKSVQHTYLVDISDKMGDRYRFGFNGKEKVNEWAGIGNFQDYGFRDYDVRIARFIREDPLTAKYPMLTPYQFAGNNPVRYIDLDGLEPANNPSAPGTKEKVAMATVYGIATKAEKNTAEANLFSKGGWSDGELKGSEYCMGGGDYRTDTDPNSAKKLNLFVSSNSVFSVDESQANRFDNYEAFVVAELVGNFQSGTGPENYSFPTNGVISSKFYNSDIFKSALADYNSGNLKPNEKRQYSFGLQELGKDYLKNGLFNIVGMTGSAQITFVPNEKGVQVKIFNVMSLSSGALAKNPNDIKTFPNSYVRDPKKTTPYGNISQTFNLFIPKSSPLLNQ